MIKLLRITRSDRPGKKMMAVFEIDGRENTTHFGDSSMRDYTTHPTAIRESRKSAYLSRHKANEDWSDPTSAGALARYVLWSKPTISEGIKHYKKVFGFD